MWQASPLAKSKLLWTKMCLKVASQNQPEPVRTSQNQSEPTWTGQNQLEPVRTSQNQSGPPGIRTSTRTGYIRTDHTQDEWMHYFMVSSVMRMIFLVFFHPKVWLTYLQGWLLEIFSFWWAVHYFVPRKDSFRILYCGFDLYFWSVLPTKYRTCPHGTGPVYYLQQL